MYGFAVFAEVHLPGFCVVVTLVFGKVTNGTTPADTASGKGWVSATKASWQLGYCSSELLVGHA